MTDINGELERLLARHQKMVAECTPDVLKRYIGPNNQDFEDIYVGASFYGMMVLQDMRDEDKPKAQKIINDLMALIGLAYVRGAQQTERRNKGRRR